MNAKCNDYFLQLLVHYFDHWQLLAFIIFNILSLYLWACCTWKFRHNNIWYKWWYLYRHAYPKVILNFPLVVGCSLELLHIKQIDVTICGLHHPCTWYKMNIYMQLTCNSCARWSLFSIVFKHLHPIVQN